MNSRETHKTPDFIGFFLARLPSLTAALTYEIIFQIPVRELFAGLYEQVCK